MFVLQAHVTRLEIQIMSRTATEVGISLTSVQHASELFRALKESRFGRRWEHDGYCVIYARAECRCEYCGLDLTSDLSVWTGFHLDHILPECKYDNLVTQKIYGYKYTGTDYLNLALTCGGCNKVKKEFDPGAGIVNQSATDISPEQRRQLVQCARDEVQRRRKDVWEETRLQVRDILAQFRTPANGLRSVSAQIS